MLLALNNVSFSFGARTMLDEVNWQIGEKERIGIVGPNGAGKSTLLKMIDGVYSIESGDINKAGDLTIGFFNQDLLSYSTNKSILWVAMNAFEKAMAIQHQLDDLTHKLETDAENEKLLMEYSELLHDFEVAGVRNGA